jgi:N6-adenosine-specific RNA methylase IME4
MTTRYISSRRYLQNEAPYNVMQDKLSTALPLPRLAQRLERAILEVENHKTHA